MASFSDYYSNFYGSVPVLSKWISSSTTSTTSNTPSITRSTYVTCAYCTYQNCVPEGSHWGTCIYCKRPLIKLSDIYKVVCNRCGRADETKPISSVCRCCGSNDTKVISFKEAEAAQKLKIEAEKEREREKYKKSEKEFLESIKNYKLKVTGTYNDTPYFINNPYDCGDVSVDCRKEESPTKQQAVQSSPKKEIPKKDRAFKVLFLKNRKR